MSTSQKEKMFTTKKIAMLAVLIAIQVVLSRFLSISMWNIKIGFAFLPVAYAGYQFGAFSGMAVGALGDLIGALLFPIGPYFPGFTITTGLVGLCYGLFLHNRLNLKNIILCVLTTQIFGSLLLNTVWVSVLYHSPFLPLLGTRSIQVAVMIAVEIIVLRLVLVNVQKVVKASMFQ